MANPQHLVKIREGVQAWNKWRDENPRVEIDLCGAELNEANLGDANLSSANLTKAKLNKARFFRASLTGANLSGANLQGAILHQADMCIATLHKADLREADLSQADLSHTNLAKANLSKASLIRTTLTGADLRRANLSDATLIYSDLCGAKLNSSTLINTNLGSADLMAANLSDAVLMDASLVATSLVFANLTRANLCRANLSSACLQEADLHKATLTDACLWEIQRARWSITEIICERAYWDPAGEIIEHYAPGEFERLYSDTTRIELLYPGGISTFELNTLPALLHHLASKYPNAGIRLKSMEETSGGAKISLTIEDTNPETIDEIRAEATRSQSAQLALRDDEIARLKIQKQLLLEEVFPRMLAAAPQLHFAGEATNVAIAIGNSTVTAHQTSNDTKALLALLDQIKAHTAELPRPQQTQLEAATQSIEHELSKPEPKRSVIASGLKAIKEIAMKVVTSEAEKALEEHWHPWLSQLTSLIHHWTS
jgi:uncharacterized protein YjbI with pentapeptide repeats